MAAGKITNGDVQPGTYLICIYGQNRYSRKRNYQEKELPVWYRGIKRHEDKIVSLDTNHSNSLQALPQRFFQPPVRTQNTNNLTHACNAGSRALAGLVRQFIQGKV